MTFKPDIHKGDELKKCALDHMTCHSSNSQGEGRKEPSLSAETQLPREWPHSVPQLHCSKNEAENH